TLDDVLAAEQHTAAGDLRRRPQDLHHRVAERALAAAGLAGEADDLAGADRERDAVDRPDRARARDVVDDEGLALNGNVGRDGKRQGHARLPGITRARSRWRRVRTSFRRRGFETSSM